MCSRHDYEHLGLGPYIWQCEEEVCLRSSRDMGPDRPAVLAHPECLRRTQHATTQAPDGLPTEVAEAAQDQDHEPGGDDAAQPAPQEGVDQ